MSLPVLQPKTPFLPVIVCPLLPVLQHLAWNHLLCCALTPYLELVSFPSSHGPLRKPSSWTLTYCVVIVSYLIEQPH
jgi:hypothetical protein